MTTSEYIQKTEQYDTLKGDKSYASSVVSEMASNVRSGQNIGHIYGSHQEKVVVKEVRYVRKQN